MKNMRVYRCNIATIAVKLPLKSIRGILHRNVSVCSHSVAIYVQNIDLTVSNGIPIYAIKIVI